MPTYRVTYAHSDENATNEKEQHGFATAEIDSDLPVETEEHLMEIARAIGHEHGYTSVGVMDIKLKVTDEEKDSPE